MQAFMPEQGKSEGFDSSLVILHKLDPNRQLFDRRADGKDRSYSCLVAAKKDNTPNYDRHRHLKFVNPCILSCNRLCRHVSNVLGGYLLCMDAWHFINKTFISIYFIKFPDLSLKYHSDLYSYGKNQDYVYGKGSTMVLGKNKIRFEMYTVKRSMWKKHHINYLHKLLA